MFRTTVAAAALAAALTTSAPALAAGLGPTTLLSAVAGSTTSGGDDRPIALGSPNDHEAITPDGRYMAFTSLASNLVAGSDTNLSYDVFWHDFQTGETKLVSVDSGGSAAAAGTSDSPTISDDGRYVTFASKATNVVAGFTDGNGFNGYDVYLRDMQGAGTTTLLSRTTASAVAGGNGSSYTPLISANGHVVVWSTRATDMESPSIVGGAAMGSARIVSRDLAAATTTFVTVDPAGTTVGDVGFDGYFAITPDARYVAFQADDYNLVSGFTSPGSGADFVFRRDLQTQTTVLVSHLPGQPTQGANSSSGFAPLSISDDGRFISYESDSTDLLGGGYDSHGGSQVLRWDATTGVNTLVSGTTATNGGNGNSNNPHMTPDGRYVSFVTDAPDLVPGDTNNVLDLLRWDGTTGIRKPVATGAGTTTPAQFGSAGVDYRGGAMSSDGTKVAFATDATNLVSGFTHSAGTGSDVYLHDFTTGANQLISTAGASATTGGNASSANVWISAAGTRVTFTSKATNLIDGFVDGNGAGVEDLFARATSAPAGGGQPEVDGGGEGGGGGGVTTTTTDSGGSPTGGGSPAPSGGGPTLTNVPPKKATPSRAGKGIVKRGTKKRDKLTGTAFVDKLYGLAGDDTIRGLAGNDVLEGGDGRDTIDGGLGRDTIRGGAGDDTIKARGGRGDVDTIDCGAGKHDVATVDKADKVHNCETVRRK